MRNKLIKKILTQAEDSAINAESIIIIGEFGSGKSWLAQKIHNLSDRRNNPFIMIDCHTLDEEVARETIFGYLSFTEQGVRINKGRLEQCGGGTLFFKGFDSFPRKLQMQIIDSFEKSETSHIGSRLSIPIDINIIISIDIDLFYNSISRYNFIKSVLGDYHETIFYPPLRQRRDEIAFLIDTFLMDDLATRYSFAAREISPRAIYQCISYDWPGNVKQLKNAIEHAAIISAGNSIQPEHLPLTIQSGQPNEEKMEILEHDISFKKAEKQLLKNVIERTGSLQKSARLLGLDSKTLGKKLKKYDLVDIDGLSNNKKH